MFFRSFGKGPEMFYFMLTNMCKFHNEELNDFYSSPNILQVIKSRRMRWEGHVARVCETGEVRTGF